MEVIVAEYAGFCQGVARAVKLAQQAPKPIASLGPLVHNRQVVGQLAAEGVRPVSSLDEVEEKRVLLRSHGVGPGVRQEAAEKGLEVIDATCPYVARAQMLAKELSEAGYQVVIAGDPEHPEVKGLVEWSGGQAMVVPHPEAAKAVPFHPKIALIAQTTETEAKLNAVAAALRPQTDNLVVHNTICRATQRRQEAAVALARKVDVMVVVGGKESANTRRLVELCRATGTPTYHVEQAGELCRQWFEGARLVGVTAGASTPAWTIEEVVKMLNDQEVALKEENVLPPIPETKEGSEEGKEPAPKAAAGSNGPAHTEEPAEVNAPASEPAAESREEAQPAATDETTGGEVEQSLAGFKELRRGSLITGTVVQIRDTEVLVDVGAKAEAIIPLNELSQKEVADPREVVAVGDEIKVVVVRPENEEGHPVVSKRRADRRLAWDRLEEAFETGEVLQGEVTEVVKGGLLVDVGVRGFVPASLVERGYVEDLSVYLGKPLRLKVIEIDRGKNKVVLSQKAVLDEEYERQRQETWDSLEVGQVRKGVVRRLTNFGAFVDLGAVDGLLHVSEISWGRVEHPRDVLKEGQEIEVKVLGIDREAGKVSLGRKALLPNPWHTARERYPAGTIVNGKVLRLAPFGVFVEVEPGIEGLVHISQLADRHVEKPEEVVSVGDIIPVKVLSVDQEAQRMSLSLRQALRAKARSNSSREAERKAENINPHNDGGVTIGELFGDLLEEAKEKDNAH
ncbi:MAG: small subunit ribosomal protein ispH, lytB [Clostridia bacterium]|nr:small subunit ribosomal protein ispH, lytB [Clostridia bacterium]